MLYIIIALAAIAIGTLGFLLVKQIEKVKALEAEMLEKDSRLEDSHSTSLELIRVSREAEELRRNNEQLRQEVRNISREAQDRVVSIELLAGELDRTEQAATAAVSRKAPQDRRPNKKTARPVSRQT